jgi:hypothetical protein
MRPNTDYGPLQNSRRKRILLKQYTAGSAGAIYGFKEKK